MTVRDKYEGCDSLVKTVLTNNQEVLCEATPADESTVISDGKPIKTWIVDFRTDIRTGVKYYFDTFGIAYKKVKPV